MTTATAAPAFHITFDTPPTPFVIDAGAFQRWINSKDLEDFAYELPSQHSEAPSRDLQRLLADAEDNGVIHGDPRLQLQVFGDEDEDGSGYYVFIANTAAAQPPIQLSTGWHELRLAAATMSADQAAHDYLSTVINDINSVLAAAIRS